MDFSTIRLFRLPVAVKITLSLSIVMLGIGYLIALLNLYLIQHDRRGTWPDPE